MIIEKKEVRVFTQTCRCECGNTNLIIDHDAENSYKEPHYLQRFKSKCLTCGKTETNLVEDPRKLVFEDLIKPIGSGNS